MSGSYNSALGAAEGAGAIGSATGSILAGFTHLGAVLPHSNGDLSLSTSVVSSSFQGITGLLGGVKWAGSTVTFGFPDSAAGYQADHPESFTNFSQLSDDQMDVVQRALDSGGDTPAAAAGLSVEGFTNLTLTAVGTTAEATIRLANTSDPDTAYAYYPSNTSEGGDVFFGGSGVTPEVGNYDYHTILHELGHALGLKHGHETDEGGALPYATDSMEYSVMTYKSYVGSDAGAIYNEEYGCAQTYMMYDIAALQYMYGADFTTNSTSTTYSWSSVTGNMYVNGEVALAPGDNRVFETIWDGGGDSDTYNLANYTTNLKIDLTPGSYSTFSSAQLAYLGGGPNGGYARGNVFNALQYNGDERSLIENAIGGSGNDKITGNIADNGLYGNGGNDTLLGGAGDDLLNGSTGADSMTGGAGDDCYYVQNSLDKVIETASSGGTDTVHAAINFILPSFVETLDLDEGASILTGTGNALANTIEGNSFANTLRGMAGTDRIEGGLGADILVGGSGADTFVFTDPDDSNQNARDIIRAGDGAIAFEAVGVTGGDRIDLSSYDANIDLVGTQDFVFGSSMAAGRLWAVNSGTTTLIRGNVDGDATVEFEIQIEDGAVLASAYKAVDFVL